MEDWERWLADSGHDASLQEPLNTLGVSGSGIPF